MNPEKSSGTNSRIDVADVLRGIAIGGIVIIHFLEHLDFFEYPEWTPLDHTVWEVTFFLLAGKMYAVFALLFGFSFFIQDDNRRRRGEDFRLRFAWRMVLLMGLGAFDLMFYNGDILFLYAVCALPVIPFIRASDRVLKIAALILLVQPVELVLLVKGLVNPEATLPAIDPGPYFEIMTPVKVHGGFFDVAAVDFRCGIAGHFAWSLHCGRLTQIVMLFISGILIGRRRLLCDEGGNMRIWKRVLAGGLVVSAVMIVLLKYVQPLFVNECVSHSLEAMFGMWRNLAMMLVIVSCVVLAFYRTKARAGLMKIAPYGRMSLTNYIGQSVMGSLLFYGWGFGLYRYAGPAISLLMGIAVVLLQYLFCVTWLRYHRRGPFEELWSRATWIFSKNR